MAGEKLEKARLGPLGIEGDRVIHVENARQRLITSRTHPRFLGHKGTLGPKGEPLVDGQGPGTARRSPPWLSTSLGVGRNWCATTARNASMCCPYWLPPMAPSPPSVTTIAACGPTL